MHIIPFHSRLSHFSIGKSRAVRKHISKSLAMKLYENEEEKGHSYDMESILHDEVKSSNEEVNSIDNGIDDKVSKKIQKTDTRND